MNYNISLNINKYPENWTIKRFEEIAEFYLGKTPPRNIKSYWDEKFFPWVSISDMIDFGKIYSTKELISKKAYQEIFKGKFSPKETLLMSFKLTIGRTSILKIEAFHNEAIVSIYPNEKIVDKYFLFYYLPIINYNQYFDKAIKGNTLNKSKIANLEIAIPPLPEQQAIAEVLQTIQEAKEKTELVIKTTRQLKKSMMKHLFTYGNVPLSDVDKVKLKETEIGPIPEHWQVVKLGEVAEILMGQSPPGNSYNQNDKGSPFLQGKAEFGDIYPKVIKYTTMPIKNTKINSILLSVRAPVGDVNIADKEYCIGRGLSSINFIKNFGNNYFLFYYFIYSKKNIEEMGSGSTFKAINKSQIENLIIPLPPLCEQQAIADILQAIDDKIQKEEARKKALENLFKSMLNNLMSGKIRVRII